MHSRPIHQDAAAAAYLSAKRHPSASMSDHHHAHLQHLASGGGGSGSVVSSLTPVQAQAVAAAARIPYPYGAGSMGPSVPHPSVTNAEAAAIANHRYAAMAAAAYHSMPGGAGTMPPSAPPPPNSVMAPQSVVGSGQSSASNSAAAAEAALRQMSAHLNPHSLFIPSSVSGPHNGVYRELSERYAHDLINERYKQMEAMALANDQQYYRERLLANPQALAAAIQAQQQQHQINCSSSASHQSTNSISTSSPLSLPVSSNVSFSSSTASSSIRRRPSLLPHNTVQNAEAFNLALTNSAGQPNPTTNSTNGSNASNAQSIRPNMYPNEKFDLYRYLPVDSRGKSLSSSTVPVFTSSAAELRLPSSSQSSPYAHLSQPTVVSVNSHLTPHPGLLIPHSVHSAVVSTGSLPPSVSFHPSMSAMSMSSLSHHQSGAAVPVPAHHPPIPQPSPAPSLQSHQQSSHVPNAHLPPAHHHPQSSSTVAPSYHPSSTLHSLQHNHLSPGHLLNEIHEAKRPRLLSNSDISASFASSFASASGGGSGSIPGTGGSQSFGQSGSGKPLNQELLIDTKETIDAKKEQEYNPHFEAISPTPADDQRISPIAIEKQQILDNINAIDREINKMDNQIASLCKRAHELEVVTSKPPIDLEKDKNKAQMKEPSIEQKIYSKNFKLARESREKFAQVGALNELPLYNQLLDLPLAQANHQKWLSFRKHLIEHLRKENATRNNHFKSICENYDNSMRDWLKKLEKKAEGTTKKTKDQKLRDYFERQFQELRKQREDKERLQRSGQRVRSEAEMEEVMDGLQVQELEDKKMRSYSVIPPIMYDQVLTVASRFKNRNGLIEDPTTLYRDSKVINLWTEGEKEIFREKYLQHPKNFGMIASCLERKSVADCVQYYYLSKKTENYKQLLKKHAKKRTRALAKQQQQANAQANRGSPMIKDGVLERNLKPYPQSATSVILPYAQPLASGSTAVMITIPAPPPHDTTSSKATSSTATTSKSTSTVTTILNKTSFTLTTATSSLNSTTSTLATVSTTAKLSDGSDSAINSKKDNITSDNEDNTAGVCDASTADQDFCCCLCRDMLENIAKSRLVSETNLPLYNLTPAEFRSGQRVCLKCHLKSVRSPCPIPSCNTPRRKVKRLRTLPMQWIEMPLEQKNRFVAELNIPLDARIGCARCVMRIGRRIGIVTNSSSNSTNNSLDSKGTNKKTFIRKSWSEAEIDVLRNAIKQHGKNWSLIATTFGGNKSANDCKKLFATNKREFNLASALHDYNESIGCQNKVDSDSDDELSDDSGEETSSLDEIDIRDRKDSDTASASSQLEPGMDGSLSGAKTPKSPNAHIAPPPPNTSLQDLKALSGSQGSLKSDYDSSATMSADEGNASESKETSGTATASVTNTSATFGRTSSISGSSIFNSTRNYDHLLNSLPSAPPSSSIVPTFLINPNAPSIQNHHHILTSASSSAVSGGASHSTPHPNSVTFGTLASNSSSVQNISGHGGAVGKEEPTCVRDLIYKAIEMSLQPETKNGGSAPPPQAPSTGDGPSGSAAIASLQAHHRATPNSAHPTPTPPPAASPYSALNLKRDPTPNSKPEGLAIYPSYHTPNVTSVKMPSVSVRAEQDEVQDLSKKPSTVERKPTASLQPQIDALRPNSRGSPYNEPRSAISSSPGLRASPSLKAYPPPSTTPTLYQQQLAGLPQPAHSNPAMHSFGIDPKLLPKGSPYSAATLLPLLQQQQQQQQQSERNKLKANAPSPMLIPPNSLPPLMLQTGQSVVAPPKGTIPFAQLSPKSSSNSVAYNNYRDKILPPSGGSITQGTPVVIPGQQPFLAAAGKFVPPPNAAALSMNAGNYEAIMRRIGQSGPGSITAGTPLSVNNQPLTMPGLTVSAAVSSLASGGASNRKEPMVDKKLASAGLSRGANIYEAGMYEQLYKSNNRIGSPNSHALSAAANYRPFSPNYQAAFAAAAAAGVPPPPPPPTSKSTQGPKTEQMSNQLLIDFNSSKQIPMHRRSSSSSEKEQHILPNSALSMAAAAAAEAAKHRPSPNAQFHLGSTPPPNPVGLFINERTGAIMRDDGKLIPPPGAEHLAHAWMPGYNFNNRQNVIQQWGAQVNSVPPAATPPNSASAKASVIQAPKSSSPRDHFLVQNAELNRRNSVSPLVTGGASASTLYPSGLEAFATLVNTAAQQPSLSVPQSLQSSVGSRLMKDALSKTPSAEGFEKCLIENMQHQQAQQHTTNKQTARIVFPPSQEELTLADLANKAKVQEELNKLTRLKVESLDPEILKRFSPATSFQHLIQQQQQQLSAADSEKMYLHEQRKKYEQLANNSNAPRSGGASPSPLPSSNTTAGGGSNSDRFRAEMLNSNPSSPSLKLPREPFSSEHFDRELRHIDLVTGKIQGEPELIDDRKVVLRTPNKPTSEQMDEASKLFSQSFQKDSTPSQDRNSNSAGHVTAANLIDAIITRQINTDSTSSSRGGAPPGALLNNQAGPPPPNFARVGGFRTGLEGGPPVGPATAPPGPIHQQVQPPPRPASTSVASQLAQQQVSVPNFATLTTANHNDSSVDNAKAKAHDFSKVLSPSVAPSTMPGPAGSLRETIFNVITNNFTSSSGIVQSPAGVITTAGGHSLVMDGGVGSKPSMPILATHQSMPSLMDATNNSNSSVDKLRKALQLQGEKHSLMSSEAVSSLAKRQATEAEMHRQVIQLVKSPPGTVDSDNSGSSNNTTTTVTATHWPPVQVPPLPQRSPITSSSATVTGGAQWSMPTLSFLTNPNAATLSTNKSNQPTGALNDFFQNRIAEAMKGPEEVPTKRTETPKSSSGFSGNDGKSSANIIFPDSPSSPGEMVIDENRPSSVSPDINRNTSGKVDSSPATSTNASASGPTGVIKRLSNNDPKQTSFAGHLSLPTTTTNKSSEPHFEPLSDDDEITLMES